MTKEKKLLPSVDDIFKPLEDAAKTVDSTLLDIGVAVSAARRKVEPFVRAAEVLKRIHDLSFALLKVPYEILVIVEDFIDRILEGSLLTGSGSSLFGSEKEVEDSVPEGEG